MRKKVKPRHQAQLNAVVVRSGHELELYDAMKFLRLTDSNINCFVFSAMNM